MAVDTVNAMLQMQQKDPCDKTKQERKEEEKENTHRASIQHSTLPALSSPLSFVYPP